MADKNLTIKILANDLTGKTFEGLNSKLKEAESASRKFALGLAAVAGGVGFLGKQMLDSAGSYEQSEIGFTTMLGSAEKADKLLRELTDFAKKTPFELRGLEDQTKKLLAYGFTEENVLETTRMLGDIASGVGMDKLPNLTLAFGQVKAATRLTGMELRQFTEAGVPLLDEVAKAMGKSVKETQEMITKGEVGFPIVEEALRNLTGESGRFYNMMDKQSKSLGGMVSNLRDSWDLFLRNEGQKLLEWGKNLVQWAIYFVENVLPMFITKISELTTWLREHEVAIAIVAGAIVGALIPAVYGMVVAFGALAISLAPFMITGAIIGGLIYAIWQLVKNWDEVKIKLGEIWSKISGFFQAGYEFIKEKIDGMISIIENLVSKVKNAIEWLDKLSLKNIGNAWKNLPANLGFGGGKAIGGPVNSGTSYLVGERGPELFVPSSSGSIIPNNKMGGLTINITGNTLLDSRSAEKIGDMIITKLGMTNKYAY